MDALSPSSPGTCRLAPLRMFALLVALTLAGCHTPPSSDPKEHNPPAWHRLDVGLCEDYPEESRTWAAAERDLALAAASGAKVLRIAFGWDAMEPAPGRYDWSFWDDVVRTAVEKHQLRLIPYVCYTPQWAATDPGPDHWKSPPRDPALFASFVQTLVRRYRPWIQSWELWNEPDNQAYWTGTVADFAALTRAGAAAVRRADPTATVVLGGLAGDLDFLDTLFREEAIAPHVDVVNLHSYLETWHPEPIEVVTREIARARDIVRTFGEDEPLWMAEVGYSPVGPRAQTSEVYRPRITQEHTAKAQADALLRFLTLVAATGEVDLFAWYRINDLPSTEEVIGDDNNRHLGLLARDGSTKPALPAFVEMAKLFSGRYRVHPLDTRLPNGAVAPAVHAFLLEPEDGVPILLAWSAAEGSAPLAGPVRPPGEARSRSVIITLPKHVQPQALTSVLSGEPAEPPVQPEHRSTGARVHLLLHASAVAAYRL